MTNTAKSAFTGGAKEASTRHGGLSQWGRSNRPRIRPGTVKSLNAPWELS